MGRDVSQHRKELLEPRQILPRPITSGPSDAAIEELKALLVEFSDSTIDMENLLNHVSEQWTEAPQSDMRKRQLRMWLAKHQTKRRLTKASQWFP